MIYIAQIPSQARETETDLFSLFCAQVLIITYELKYKSKTENNLGRFKSLLPCRKVHRDLFHYFHFRALKQNYEGFMSQRKMKGLWAKRMWERVRETLPIADS